MKGKMINMKYMSIICLAIGLSVFFGHALGVHQSSGIIEKLEVKIADLEVKAEAQKIKIASLEAKLNNCPGNLEAAKLENSKLKEQLGAAADNLEKLKTSLKNLLSPARKIINLCDAVGNMCMIDKAKLLNHINSLRVHVAPGE